jgi:hypothetical protein
MNPETKVDFLRFSRPLASRTAGTNHGRHGDQRQNLLEHCSGMATSAIWKLTQRPSFAAFTLASDHSIIDSAFATAA